MSALSELSREPWAFDFHTAMRRLECEFRDRPRTGEARRPRDEPVRLGQDASLAFQPAALAGFQLPDNGAPARLRVAFLGLFGTQGPLPLHLTEHARDRLRGIGDRTFAAFVDLFHHRMMMLFHRAWASAEPTANRDRPWADAFTRYIGSLLGQGFASMLGRDALPDYATLQFVSRLGPGPRNAEGLAAIVETYFGVRSELEEFVGRWLDIPPENRWQLGYSRDVSVLGQTSVVGARVYQRSQKFRVTLGPLSRDDFQSFLPGTRRLELLSRLVRLYAGDELDWDVRLVLAPDQRRQLALGRDCRLGYDSWLGQNYAAGFGVEDIIIEPPVAREPRPAC